MVLEAMKMENALPSPASGTIKSVGFSSGDSVAKGDVLAAQPAASAPSPAAASAPVGREERVKMTRLRQTIAKRLTENSSVPTFTVTQAVDMTDLLGQLRSDGDANGFQRPFAALVLAEVARHCRYWDELGLPPFRIGINISPLIDMVFILLIFFMVSTTFVKDMKLDLDRPAASSAVTASTR